MARERGGRCAITALSIALVAVVVVAAGCAQATGGQDVTASSAAGVSTAPAPARRSSPPARPTTTAPPTTVPAPSTTMTETVGPASTLGHRPAGLDQLARPAVVPPARLHVPDLGLDAEVTAVSTTADSEVAVPPSGELVAWYEYGPAPGDPGTAVLAAHVDWNGRRGAFFDLDRVGSGALVVVVRNDGTEVAFRVVSVERVPKSELPVDQLFARDGAPRLALVTCGGDFDRSRGHYADNVIAWAEPA